MVLTKDDQIKLNKKVELNYEYISTQEDALRVLNWAEKKKFIVFDTETTGLNPFSDSLILMQFGDEEKQWIVDARGVKPETFKSILENPKITKIGQNLKFDWKFMYRYGIKMTPVADTMITEQILRCGIGADISLEGLANHYIGVRIDKDPALRHSFGITQINQFTERQLEYSARDVILPLLVARKQKPIVDQRGLRETVSLEFKALPVIAKMDTVGMRIDTKQWLLLYQEALKKLEEAEKNLDKFFGVTPTFQEDLFSSAKLIRPIEYSSWQQIVKALSKKGIHVDSTGKNKIALAAVLGEMPMEFVAPLLQYRVYFTKVVRYGINFIEAINPITGRVHSDFTQCFTTTGRLSSGKSKEGGDFKLVNLQNIPRDKKYRSCFIPDPGNVFIVYDFKSIEPRVMGDLSQDPFYMQTFLNKEDIYNKTGTNIYKEEVSKTPGRPNELRTKAKIGILGTAYGTGKEKFHKKMLLDINLNEEGFFKDNIELVSKDESNDVWEGIFQLCATLKDSLDEWSRLADPVESQRKIYDEVAAAEPFKQVYAKVIEVLQARYGTNKTVEEIEELAKQLTMQRGFVTFSQTVGGRKRFFKVYHASWWTEGRNHPIQGTAGGDIMKYAMVSLQNRIDEEGDSDKVFIINQVHDEILVETSVDIANRVNKYVPEILVAAGNRFLQKIPCEVEGGIVSKWEK